MKRGVKQKIDFSPALNIQSTMNTISLSMTDSDKPLHLVVWQDKAYQPQEGSLKERIDLLENTIASLNERNVALEKLVNQLLQRSAYFPPDVCPTPAGLEVRQRGASVADSATVLEALINVPTSQSQVKTPAPQGVNTPAPQGVKTPAPQSEVKTDAKDADADADADEDEVEVEVDADEEEDADADEDAGVDAAADADAEADADAADADAAEADAADADADDEEAMELEEFEWKGVTYYRDSENQVYQKDEDGDLDDTPIGVWNEEKKKVLKYALK